MPFPQQPSRTFNRAGIEALTPGQYGCYGIFRADAWIYIGKGDIRARLLVHLAGQETPCIMRNQPTHFVGIVTNDADNEEKQLILEFNPVCNQKVG